MRLKTLLITSLPLLLTGCPEVRDDPPPEPVVLVKHIHSTCGTPPQRNQVQLRPITWEIIGDRFTLSPSGYEDLSYNVSEIWAGVEELLIEIGYYEQCLEELKTRSVAGPSASSG